MYSKLYFWVACQPAKRAVRSIRLLIHISGCKGGSKRMCCSFYVKLPIIQSILTTHAIEEEKLVKITGYSSMSQVFDYIVLDNPIKTATHSLWFVNWHPKCTTYPPMSKKWPHCWSVESPFLPWKVQTIVESLSLKTFIRVHEHQTSTSILSGVWPYTAENIFKALGPNIWITKRNGYCREFQTHSFKITMV